MCHAGITTGSTAHGADYAGAAHRWYRPGAGLRILMRLRHRHRNDLLSGRIGQVTESTAAGAFKFAQMRCAPRLARASVLRLPFAALSSAW
jgi:hypothetical protein